MEQILIVLLACILAIALGCEDALCNHGDFGSCGNACCTLSFTYPSISTVDVMNAMNATIVEGGPDKLYTPKMTAEGTLTFGDLRPYGKDVDFIGQTYHETQNGLYTDTINFTLKPTLDSASGVNGTYVKAFSISQIAGAYGDDGQNYFNIVQLMESIPLLKGVSAVNVDASCPKSTA